ncbi:MAG TPA: sigma-70 family RNA polymerase sigma factor [Caulobacteraceae bacterium]|jgi:RNA polymerase sigma-70 factor (ECF subfamily)
MHAIAIDQGRYRRRSWAPLRLAAPMTRPPAASDGFAEMIGRIAAHADRAAFAALFGHFAPRVKSYMLRLGAEPALAEELAQETLLTVWRKAAAFDRAKAAPSTWIFTIARNLRIDAARRARRGDPVEDPSDVPEAEPTPDAALAAAQSVGRIRVALLKLPAEQAEVVRLSYFSDKPHSEIAEELQLPLGTVKSRLRLAMGRLRELLGDLA